MADPCREAFERAFTGSNRTAAAWAAFKANWRDPFVITDAMVEAGALALCGDTAIKHPDNAAWGRRCARKVLEAALAAAGVSGSDALADKP